MKAKFFLSVAIILCVARLAHAQAATYQPNDVVRSTDVPTLHVTFDNLAPGAGTQSEALSVVGSTRFFRRVQFESVTPPTDQIQMPPPWVHFVGHYDSNATVGSITNTAVTIGGLTPIWNTDNSLTLWFGGPGGGAAGGFGVEGTNNMPTWAALASAPTVSKAGRAQQYYDSTLGTWRYSYNGGAWSSFGSGTVTSVGLALPGQFTVTGSPVTGAGTLTGSWNTQTTNLVFASPNGSTGVPTFRALAAADVPALAYVTSVGLSLPADFTVTGSPVTASGTLTATRASQSANLFLASPSGSAGAPSYRALATADYGTGTVSSTSILDGTILFADWSANACTANQVPSRNAGNTAWVCSSPAGTGTVTSVAVAAPAEFTVTGSPITGAGTITLAKATQTANLIYAGPTSGGAAAPTFRALVAADIPGGVGSTVWCTPDITTAQFPASAAAYFAVGVGDHLTVEFINAAATSAYYLCTLPTSYDATSFVVALNWTSSATTGNIVWGVNIEKEDGLQASNTFGATAGNGSTQTTATVATNASANLMSQTTITYTNANAGSVTNTQTIRIRVQRVGNSGSDTLGVAAELHSLFVRK